jgi:hypothetical protein
MIKPIEDELRKPVTIDWETNCVNAIQGYILSNEYMREHYAKILHRVLFSLDRRNIR